MTTTPMTEARLAEIEARAEKATPGEWRAVHRGVGKTAEDDGDGFLGLEILGPPDDCQRGQFSCSADARFIAASRTDVPDLVAEVRRLRELLREAFPALAAAHLDSRAEYGALLRGLLVRIEDALQ